MALIAVSGQPGCRFEEVARISAHRLGLELVNESRINGLIERDFGADGSVPSKARADLIASILARLATEYHLVYCAAGAAQRAEYKTMFGRATAPPYWFDLILNAESMDSEQMVELIRSSMHALGLKERGFLSPAAEAQIQFQFRLRLARHGIVPPGAVHLPGKTFAHPSEQIFANLLDFYRIAWEYEPRSFPVQWDAGGRVSESFSPDFYLPEFDLYVELTTMKQSLVTRKNRKIRLLRQLYPHLNIQVFYQKDFENLIFKYGLAERPARA